jgi:hypothetical protein
MTASRITALSEPAIEAFEVHGDPAELPDAFFDALASLLLSVNETRESELDVEEPAA